MTGQRNGWACLPAIVAALVAVWTVFTFLDNLLGTDKRLKDHITAETSYHLKADSSLKDLHGHITEQARWQEAQLRGECIENSKQDLARQGLPRQMSLTRDRAMTEPMMPEIPPPGSGLATTVTTTTEARTSTPFSRKVEDGAFIVAIVLVTLWCLVAIAKSASLLPATPNQGFPWELLTLCAALVVPKTVGRATAGRIWDKLPGRG